MTQKEISVINAISCSGIDNSMWGIETCKYSDDTRHMYATDEHVKIKPHIYVYRTIDAFPEINANVVKADRTLKDKFGQYIDLYFIDMEGGAQ